jgi:signal transduction histidine kinase/CheY-like chemotaxis protein
MRPDEQIAALEQRIAKLEKINEVLMDRAESSVSHHANAYSLFQTAIGLERQVISRTRELTQTLHKIERMNDQLMLAKNIAERANRSKTRFLAQASHDLMQPLNAAGLAIAALAEMAHDEESQQLTHQVGRSLNHIESLLKTLIEISRLDAGILVPQVSTVALNELLSDIAIDYAPFAAKRGLGLRVRPAHLYVATDRSMLIRILQNLVGNALRYTRQGRVLVGVRRHSTTVHLDVYDTGPGIAQDQYALIFEEFHRGRGAADSHDTDLGPGLGLGLSIVQRLVDALGHGISLRSQVGRGTCFSIELPRVPEPVLTSRLDIDPRWSLGWGISGALVAVIDDDTTQREAITALVTRWHGEAIPASSGTEASRLVSARGRRPDLLVVDYHLNDETAFEAIAGFDADHGSGIPIIIITADDDMALEDRVRAAGWEFLHKPVKPAALRALMVHLLG